MTRIRLASGHNLWTSSPGNALCEFLYRGQPPSGYPFLFSLSSRAKPLCVFSQPPDFSPPRSVACIFVVPVNGADTCVASKNQQLIFEMCAFQRTSFLSFFSSFFFFFFWVLSNQVWLFSALLESLTRFIERYRVTGVNCFRTGRKGKRKSRFVTEYSSIVPVSHSRTRDNNLIRGGNTPRKLWKNLMKIKGRVVKCATALETFKTRALCGAFSFSLFLGLSLSRSVRPFLIHCHENFVTLRHYFQWDIRKLFQASNSMFVF